MAKETMREIMQGVTHDEAPRPRVIANNTVEYHRDGRRIIRLHHTDIAEFSANGRTVTLNSGGWKTVTTKDRFYECAKVCIRSERGIWYYNETVFFDGIKIQDSRVLNPPKKSVAEKQKTLADNIRKFVARLNKLESLPQPNSGDCWHCSMFDRAEGSPQRGQPGDGTGKRLKDPSHLLSHIKEGYLHGALLVNAMRWAGRTDYAIGLAFKDKRVFGQWAARDLRRFLRTQLGLPT